MSTENKHLAAFEHLVANRYQEYSQLFLDLPFSGIPNAGCLLSKFSKLCSHEMKKKTPPNEIVDIFFDKHMKKSNSENKSKMLFLFLQFIERQIVLFDALEDSAFSTTHNLSGDETLNNFPSNKKIKDFNNHIVLTAHPTQFYSPQVLSILQDITTAISSENMQSLKDLLLQMGKTPFLRHVKPTPLDEAEFLIVYLTDIFYKVCQDIQFKLNQSNEPNNPIISLGFWPGGDRDGNPNVNTETTIQVASMLKKSIISCYLKDINKLKRRLTFRNVYRRIKNIENRLIINSDNPYQSPDELIRNLISIKKTLDTQHDGLFSHYIEHLISAIRCFGFHFATLDIRQDSRVHSKAISKVFIKDYLSLSSEDKSIFLLSELTKKERSIDTGQILKDKALVDIFSILSEIPNIQNKNGVKGLHRYIISNTHGAHNVLEVMLLAKYCGITQEKLILDIVPLFESIEDLKNGPNIVESLFKLKLYKQHLKHRKNTQIIMLGFSDSTKDGGYLTANWSIYNTKKNILKIAKKYHVKVLFFDGRGGPPARGGGHTHQFYKAMQHVGASDHIELTIQGQTISSNFGSQTSAKYNIEQLITAGADKRSPPQKLSLTETKLINKLSDISHITYNKFRNHPKFIDYLENITPLPYFGDLNIASRPPRRNKDQQLTLEDLRAISFVGAWSQMKQNVPAFFGLGTAINTLIKSGHEQQLKILYEKSLYFKTLLDNTMQSLLKSYFPLTEYLSTDKTYGDFWNILNAEAKLTTKMLLRISQQSKLLEGDPVVRRSIELRDEIVLPLQIIQQYALISLRGEHNKKQQNIFKKLIKRSMPTNINASRNSA